MLLKHRRVDRRMNGLKYEQRFKNLGLRLENFSLSSGLGLSGQRTVRLNSLRMQLTSVDRVLSPTSQYLKQVNPSFLMVHCPRFWHQCILKTTMLCAQDTLPTTTRVCLHDRINEVQLPQEDKTRQHSQTSPSLESTLCSTAILAIYTITAKLPSPFPMVSTRLPLTRNPLLCTFHLKCIPAGEITLRFYLPAPLLQSHPGSVHLLPPKSTGQMC